MIVDTSALLAYFVADDPRRAAVTRVIEGATEDLVITPLIIAELDYLVMSRYGAGAERTVLEALASGAWEIATFGLDRLRAARAIVERYADIPIGLADASNLVLAEAYGTETIVTLDRRHFSILRFANGRAPRILPE